MVRRLRFVTMTLLVLASLSMTWGLEEFGRKRPRRPRRLRKLRSRSIRGTRPGCSSRPRWCWQ